MECEVCGSDDHCEIGIAKEYTNGQPLHVCRDCGFVFVKDRRSSKDIARAWERSDVGTPIYAADLASVEARHAYVARIAQDYLHKSVLDIGSGNGAFLQLLKDKFKVPKLFGVSPSQSDCDTMLDRGIPCFRGMGEDCKEKGWDAATLIWTLENTGSCKAMIKAARGVLNDGGYIIVATGSRILVPFKKPLDRYLGHAPLDLHPWRFSAATLMHLLLTNGFLTEYVNGFVDSDYLVVVGRKSEAQPEDLFPKDDYRKVLKFFRDWHGIQAL